MQRATLNILSFATIASVSVGLACGSTGSSNGSGSSTSGSSNESGSNTSGSGSGSSVTGSTATGSTSGATASGAGGTGASSGSGAAACATSATTVSFSTDLMPIFQKNCSVGGTTQGLCHGDPGVSAAMELGGQRQYFGPPTPAVTATTTPSLTTIYKGLVTASYDDPSMEIIAPNSLAQSFLWYKVTGTEMTVENMNPDPCARGDFGSCGSTMPLPLTGSTVTLLPQADLNLICNWIVQGAKNN